jgi:uncharacterized protein
MFQINLTEIPDDGREWTLTRQTGELNVVLDPLIQDSNYLAEFTIRPMDIGTFELVGTIKATLPEACSRCGLDFKWPVEERFRELLIPEIPVERNSQYVKANHISDHNNAGPSVAEYQGHTFQMGDYLHEIIALSLPSVPAPAVKEDGQCSGCSLNVRGKSFGYDEQMEVKVSPFASLRTLKN